MGEPVQILELARKVILLSGHTEDEIGIVESGIRPERNSTKSYYPLKNVLVNKFTKRFSSVVSPIKKKRSFKPLSMVSY